MMNRSANQYYFVIKYLNTVYITTNCSYIDLEQDPRYNMVANKNEVLYNIEMVLDGVIHILENRKDLEYYENGVLPDNDQFYVFAGKNSANVTDCIKKLCKNFKNNLSCNINGVEIHQNQNLNCIVFDMLENEILNDNIITV